jgi:hypothetical protein
MGLDWPQWILFGCGVAALLLVIISIVLLGRGAWQVARHVSSTQRSPIFTQLVLLQIFRNRITGDVTKMTELATRAQAAVEEMDNAIVSLRVRETVAVIRMAQVAVKLLSRTL